MAPGRPGRRFDQEVRDQFQEPGFIRKTLPRHRGEFRYRTCRIPVPGRPGRRTHHRRQGLFSGRGSSGGDHPGTVRGAAPAPSRARRSVLASGDGGPRRSGGKAGQARPPGQLRRNLHDAAPPDEGRPGDAIRRESPRSLRSHYEASRRPRSGSGPARDNGELGFASSGSHPLEGPIA